MPILVPISKPKQSKRERFEEEVLGFIEQYCSDHEAFLKDPKEYYRQQLHKKSPGAARGFGDDGSQARYFSPYEDEHRFRQHEAVGGYRCTRYGSDGVAIRAAQGHTHSSSESGAEGFKFIRGNRANSKPVLPQASMPNPIKVRGRWEYPDNPNFFAYATLYRGYNSRATRFAAMPVERPVPSSPGPCNYATVRNVRPARGLSTFIYGEPRGMFTAITQLKNERDKARAKSSRKHFDHCYKLRGEDFAAHAPSQKEIAEWKAKYWSKRRQFEFREGRLEPWCICEACQKWYPDLERADWRTVWCEETGEDLTTRKMRDLNARLGLYRYGDHHWQPHMMRKVTAKRLQEIFAGSLQTPRFYWPKCEIVESVKHTENTPQSQR